MELSVCDVTTANPSADAISRAVDASPHREEWYLCLDSQDGAVIDADVRSDGRFDVSAVDRGRDLVARAPLDGAALDDILLKMRAGDRSRTTAPFRDELPTSRPDVAAAHLGARRHRRLDRGRRARRPCAGGARQSMARIAAVRQFGLLLGDPDRRAVEVFYDPADSGNCVLERDPWSGRHG